MNSPKDQPEDQPRRSLLKAAFSTLLLFVGCSTSLMKPGPREGMFSDLSEATVLARMDSRTSRPDWLDGDVLIRKEESWLVLGFAVVPDAQGVQRSLSAAEQRARVELRAALEGRIETVLELQENPAAPDSMSHEKASRFADQLAASLPSITRLKNQYWEQVPERYRAFVQIEVSQGTLKTTLLETALNLEQRGELSAPVASSIRAQVEGIINFDSHEVAPLFQMAPAGQN